MKFPVVHILIFGILIASCPAADIEVVDTYTTLTGELENVPEEVPAEILRSVTNPTDMNNYHNNVKKIVDFGLSRGFSGIKLAKHLMALQVARYASGPGRKRRSDFPVKKRHQN